MIKNSKKRLPDIFIGTSGWSYGPWKEYFYPAGFPAAKFLAHYATKFKAVEINSTFYHTPRKTTIEKWMAQVPSSFRFCVKMHRYITHIKKLIEPDEALERFFNSISPLGNQVGPVLIQLPASLVFDKKRCGYFYNVLSSRYSNYNCVVEPRHNSWFTKESISMLKKANIGFVVSESGERFPYFEAVTAHHVYVRFHGPGKLYASPHTSEQMKDYAEKIKTWHKSGHTCWAFFNNTIGRDALDNAQLLERYLLEPL